MANVAENLRIRLREEEEKVRQAAEAGLRLLERNKMLSDELAEIRIKNEPMLEELHSLQIKCKMRSDIEEDYHNELDTLNHKLKDSYKEGYDKSQNEMEIVVKRLKEKGKQLEEELSDVRKELLARTDENSGLKYDLEQKNKQLQAQDLSGSDGLLGDATMLMQQKEDLQNELDCAKSKIAELSSHILEMTEGYNQTKEQCAEFKQLCEEMTVREKENEERYLEMKCEMEAAKVKSSMSPARMRGNSMFTELDDQRRKAEEELVNMKRRNDLFQEDNKKLTQEVDHLKYQLITAMKMTAAKGGSQDYAHLKRELNDARGEVRVLKGRLDNATKGVGRVSRPSGRPSSTSSQNAPTVPKHLMDDLAESKRECERLRARVQLIGDAVIEQEKLRIDAENKVNVLNNEMLRLKMRMGDGKGTAAIGPSSSKPIGRVEKIPLNSKNDMGGDTAMIAQPAVVQVVPTTEKSSETGDSQPNCEDKKMEVCDKVAMAHPKIGQNDNKKRAAKRYRQDDPTRWGSSTPLFDLDD